MVIDYVRARQTRVEEELGWPRAGEEKPFPEPGRDLPEAGRAGRH